jgi:hypothetical protein
MKFMTPMRLLPILLVSAMLAVSCTGVQDVADTTTPSTTPSISLNGKYKYAEVMDSIRIQVETPTPQYIYLGREYFLELKGTSEATLFVTEWASADRVVITQYVGTYTRSGNAFQLVLKNMTMCDGIDIIVAGQVQGTNNKIQLAMQHCPPVSNNIVFEAEPSISTFTVYDMKSTTHK